MRIRIVGTLLISVLAASVAPVQAKFLPAPSLGAAPSLRFAAQDDAPLVVQSSIEAFYNRKKKTIAGFVSAVPNDLVNDRDEEACLYDRKVVLFRSTKVGSRWRDTMDDTERTDEEGFFGWVWKPRFRVPSGWWNMKVTKSVFSGRYGSLIVCAPAVLTTRLRT